MPPHHLSLGTTCRHVPTPSKRRTRRDGAAFESLAFKFLFRCCFQVFASSLCFKSFQSFASQFFTPRIVCAPPIRPQTPRSAPTPRGLRPEGWPSSHSSHVNCLLAFRLRLEWRALKAGSIHFPALTFQCLRACTRKAFRACNRACLQEDSTQLSKALNFAVLAP